MKEMECKSCKIHYLLDEGCNHIPDCMVCTCESRSFKMIES